MSLLAMSLGLRFCASRKDGTGEGRWVSAVAEIAWLLLGLAVESPWLALDGHYSPPLHE